MHGELSAYSITEDQVSDVSFELRIARYESDLGHVKKNMAQMATALTALQAGLTAANEANIALKVDFVRTVGEIRTEMANFRSDTKQANAHLRAELKQDNATLRAEFKQDIADLRTELKQDNAALRTEIKQDNAALRSKLEQDNAALRTEIKQDNAALRAELKQDNAEVRTEVKELKQETLALRTDVSAIQAMLGQFATKADLNAMETRIIKWFIATSFAIGTLAFAIAKYVS